MNVKVNNFQPLKLTQQLTTDTSAYSTGDVLVATTEIPILAGYASAPKNLRVRIDQIGIVDKDCANGAFDIVILDSNVSLGTVNAAVSITDANALNVVKVLPVSASMYNTLKAADNSVANIDLAAPIYITTNTGSFYIGLVSRDSKTYSASALYFRCHVSVINQDL